MWSTIPFKIAEVINLKHLYINLLQAPKTTMGLMDPSQPTQGACGGWCDKFPPKEKQDMLGAAGPAPELAPPAATPGALVVGTVYR